MYLMYLVTGQGSLSIFSYEHTKALNLNMDVEFNVFVISK